VDFERQENPVTLVTKLGIKCRIRGITATKSLMAGETPGKPKDVTPFSKLLLFMCICLTVYPSVCSFARPAIFPDSFQWNPYV